MPDDKLSVCTKKSAYTLFSVQTVKEYFELKLKTVRLFFSFYFNTKSTKSNGIHFLC